MRELRTKAAAEAQKIYDLATKGSLSLPALFSTLMQLQSEAYGRGLHAAVEPMKVISDDIDRRMIKLGLDGMGDSGDLHAS